MAEPADDDDDGGGTEVVLHVYDLSVGFAPLLSPLLLGKQIAGIWHTGVVIRGREYYFGNGINVDLAGNTPFQSPTEVLRMGKTYVPPELIEEILIDLSQKFTPESYSLLHHNCNNFSNEFCHFLVGKGVPEHILHLTRDVAESPLGMVLSPVLDMMEQMMRSAGSGEDFTGGSNGGHGGRDAEVDAREASDATEGRIQTSRVPEEEEDSGRRKESGPSRDEPPPAAGEVEDEKMKMEEEFRSLVEVEFRKLMEDGKLTAQEAVVQALTLAKESMSGSVSEAVGER